MDVRYMPSPESAVSLIEENELRSPENYMIRSPIDANFPSAVQDVKPELHAPPQTAYPQTAPPQTAYPQTTFSQTSTEHLLQQLANIEHHDLSKAQVHKYQLQQHRLMPLLYHVLCDHKAKTGLKQRHQPEDDNDDDDDHQKPDAQLSRLDNMLIAEGVAESKDQPGPSTSNVNNSIEHRFYRSKLIQIKQWYYKELSEYERGCDMFIGNTVKVLREHMSVRPINSAEVERTVEAIRKRLRIIQIQLKQQTCELVMSLRRHFLDARRRRRNFSKHASEILNTYFYAHLSNPYPSEEAKEELARKCEITISQVTNWFSNKRIRYKKNTGKAQEEAYQYTMKAAIRQAAASPYNRPEIMTPHFVSHAGIKPEPHEIYPPRYAPHYGFDNVARPVQYYQRFE